MTSICRGLKVGEGNSWAAVRIAVTLGSLELREAKEVTFGATPTSAGTVGTPDMSMTCCNTSRTAMGEANGVRRGDRPTPTGKNVVCPSRRSDKPRCWPP